MGNTTFAIWAVPMGFKAGLALNGVMADARHLL